MKLVKKKSKNVGMPDIGAGEHELRVHSSRLAAGSFK